MVKRLCALALATAVILLACVQTGPASGESSPEKPQKQEREVFDPASYTREMMQEDYDFFWTTLEENCATFGLIEEKQGINLEQIKQEYQQMISNLRDGDAEQFVQIMEMVSSRLGMFAHICVIDPKLYHQYTNGGSWESETAKEVFQSEKVQSFYQWTETLPRYQYQLKSMEEATRLQEDEAGEQSNAVMDANIQLSREDEIAIVRLKSLGFYGEGVSQVVIEKLRTFCWENLDAQHFIIDITGNPGGSSLIWSDGLDPLWAGKVFSREEVAAYKLGSMNVQMWDGWPESDSDVELRPISDLSIMDYPKLDMQSLEECDGVAIKKKVNDYTHAENPDGQEFEGRIWILTDHVVASSAEGLVHFAKGNELCTLVGTQTGGASSTMTPTPPANMTVAMPNSGMMMRYAPFYFINEDGTCLNVEGTHPDIEIGPEETPMERCLQEIAKLG